VAAPAHELARSELVAHRTSSPKGQGRRTWKSAERSRLLDVHASAEVAPAPPAFRAILANLLAPRTAPKSPDFSTKTAQLFSKMNDTWLSPVDRVRISVLLGLVSMEEITAYTGLNRAKTIATFRLSPILAAMS
jgi:hypothetical protein